MPLSSQSKKDQKIDPIIPKWRLTVLGLMIAVFVLSLLPFIYTGAFSRYQADDYCFSSAIIQNGYFGAIRENYTGWSNRFSTVMAIGLIDPLKVLGMQLLPGVLIAGMLGGLYLLMLELKKKLIWSIGRVEIFILAAMITFFTVYTAPDQFQSFYWRSGSITYTLPVVILPYLLAFIIRSDRQKMKHGTLFLSGGAGFLIALINGGFSETTAAFQVVIIALLLVLIYLKSPQKQKNQRMMLLICALAGILVAMIIMILSPGNAVRLATMPATPGLLRLIYLSFRFAAGFVVNTIETVPLPVAISFIFAFALALLANWKEIHPRNWRWLFWAIPVSAFLLVVAVCAPSAYAESAYAEARAFLPARWILTLAGIAWFYLLGMVYQNWRYRNPNFQIKKMQSFVAFVIVMLCFYPMRGALLTLSYIPETQARAQAWDTRAAAIKQEKAAGKQELEVKALDSYGRIRELSNNPKLWVNKCAAVYYGVKSLTAK
jgi:hypothetical protein